MSAPIFSRFGIIFMLVGPAMALKIWHRRMKLRHLQQQLQGRPQHSTNEFALLFPTEAQPIALTIRENLADITGLNLGGLRPEDTFEEDLQFRHFWRQGMLELIEDLEALYDIVLPDQEHCLKLTVGELIATVQAAREAPPAES